MQTSDSNCVDYIISLQTLEQIASFNSSSHHKNAFNHEKGRGKLFKLKELLKCNQCQEEYNENNRVPYLYPCGHYLCDKCRTTNAQGQFICPIDRSVLNKNNYKKTIDIKPYENNNEYCVIHKVIKSHFIEETKEILCVFCALDKMKNNPFIEIQEIKNKTYEMSLCIYNEIDKITGQIELIEKYMKDNKNCQETEKNKIEIKYNKIIQEIKLKKKELIEQIDEVYFSNEKQLTHFLEVLETYFNSFKEIIERNTQWETHPSLFVSDFSLYEKLKSSDKCRKSDNIIDYKECKYYMNTPNRESKDVLFIEFGKIIIKTINISFSPTPRKPIVVNRNNRTVHLKSKSTQNIFPKRKMKNNL